MALKAEYKGVQFGVGDKVRVTQKIKEGDKERNQYFDGTVIAIRGSGDGKNFIVRRLGAQQVGIEKIFPFKSPSLAEIKVIKSGVEGVKRAKLYFIRNKSRKEINLIYQRAAKRKAGEQQKTTSR